MKRVVVLVGLMAIVIVGLAATAVVARQAGKQDFVLVNQTKLEIHEVYVSASDKDDWEEDILGEDVLPDGDKVTIHFSKREKACVYDLKVVNEKKKEFVWEDIDLCKATKVTLRPSGKAVIE
jgi:hypothetical protein